MFIFTVKLIDKLFGFQSQQVAASVPVYNQVIFIYKISKDSWSVECNYYMISSLSD